MRIEAVAVAREPTIENYTAWCRAKVQLAVSNSQMNLLFDNSIAEPTELLRERINQCFADGLSGHYRSTFARGNPLVIDAVAARYGVERDQVTCTTGGSSGVAVIFKAYLQAGDHVIVERPYFDFLPALALSHGAQLSFIERSGPDWGIDPERLAALIQPNTRLIVLTNLHNPSGALLDDAQLRALAAVAEQAGIPLVIDEVYGDFAINPRRSGVAAGLSPMIVSVNSLTKVYGLFALKCGWIIASGAVRDRINAAYDRFEFGLSKVAHAVAAHVLDDLAPFEAHWRNMLAGSRPIVVDVARELAREGLISGAVPEFGCMYFPRLAPGIDDVAVSDWLWEHYDLAVAPGTYFGNPGHIRLGFGQSVSDVSEGMQRLRDGLRRYREQNPHGNAG